MQQTQSPTIFSDKLALFFSVFHQDEIKIVFVKFWVELLIQQLKQRGIHFQQSRLPNHGNHDIKLQNVLAINGFPIQKLFNVGIVDIFRDEKDAFRVFQKRFQNKAKKIEYVVGELWKPMPTIFEELWEENYRILSVFMLIFCYFVVFPFLMIVGCCFVGINDRFSYLFYQKRYKSVLPAK